MALYAPAPRLSREDRRASKHSFRVDSPMGRAAQDVSPRLPLRHYFAQRELIKTVSDEVPRIFGAGSGHEYHAPADTGVVSQVEAESNEYVTSDESSEHESTSSNLASEDETIRRNGTTLRPNRALVRQRDRVIYKAAWYHLLLPDSYQTSYVSGWRNQCKMEWNRSFWQLAQHDDTLLEMFLSFAAAKEAAMTGAKTSRGYYFHKGRALALIRRDITHEGRDLRVPSIAAICLLCMAAFIEGEYQAAETHLQAIAPLVSSKILAADSLPPFLWLLLTWADLRLTAVGTRSPMLPYSLHPDFDVGLPPFLEMRTTAMAKWNASNLPRSKTFRDEQALDLLEKMYAHTEIHNQQSMDWKVAWSVSYQTAFSLAGLQDMIERSWPADEESDANDRVCAFVLAARILFWFTMNKFVSQGGLHLHLRLKLMDIISKKMPAELCFQWSKHASLDALIWVLFAVYVSYEGVHFDGKGTGRHTFTASELAWLQATMKLAIKRLKIESYDEFLARLRRLPFATAWINLTCTCFAWLDGSFLVSGHNTTPSSLFALIRLNFDPMDEIDRLSGHRSLKQIDSVFDNENEERCTACREKVWMCSEEMFHFAHLKRFEMEPVKQVSLRSSAPEKTAR